MPASAAARSTTADGQLWTETQLAEKYSAARGLDSCGMILPSVEAAPPKLASIPYLLGWTSVGSCRVRLVPSFAATTRQRQQRPSRYELRYECGVHEAGHALGLQHEDAAAYAIISEDYEPSLIPGRCRAWARGVVHERRSASRKFRRP